MAINFLVVNLNDEVPNDEANVLKYLGYFPETAAQQVYGKYHTYPVRMKTETQAKATLFRVLDEVLTVPYFLLIVLQPFTEDHITRLELNAGGIAQQQRVANALTDVLSTLKADPNTVFSNGVTTAGDFWYEIHCDLTTVEEILVQANRKTLKIVH